MNDVEKAQIDLINSNRIYTIAAMSLGAMLLYFFLAPQVESKIFIFWLIAILLVDTFRIYATLTYHLAKKNNRVNYSNAKSHICIGTVLSGLCMGSLAVILVPTVDVQSLIMVILFLVVIATASTTTLSYQQHFSMIFVLLVLIPLMLCLPEQPYITDLNLLVLELMLTVLILFLLKNIKVFYYNVEYMLQRQANSCKRENELNIKHEKAETANREKSEYLANLSHELRTPMHAILGFSSLGSSKVGSAPDEKIAGYFSRINESGQRLLTLLNDLLDLSKMEAGRIDFEYLENDLQVTVNTVLEKLGPLICEHSLTLVIEPASVETTAVYDNEKIFQVIHNLLTYTIKITPDGNNIRIYYDKTKLQLDESNHQPAIENNAISVSIQNQGKGLSEDELNAGFDEFVQSRKIVSGNGGTGLGLLISKEIIERHGGVITLNNSRANDGIVFTFTLPCNQD